MRPLAISLVELCTVIVLASACQRSLDPSSVDYWADQATKAGTRTEALKELGHLGKKEAVPVLVKWLDQPGPWQGQAAYSLAQLGDPGAAAQLIKHIDYEAGSTPKSGNTDAVYTNLDIVRGLALLHSPEAVAPLVKLLQNPEQKTREVVITALGQLQAPAAVQPLMALAKAADTPPVLVATALRALGNLGAAEATPLLTTLLYNDALYEEARYALVQLGSAAVPALVQTLNRQNKDLEAMKTADGKPLPDGTVEARAASVLGAMRAQSAEAAVVAAFDKLYKRYLAKPKEAPPSIFSGVIELAYALGNLGGAAAVKALLPLTKAPNDTLRVAAAEALTTAGPDPAAVQALLAAAGSGPADARDSIIHAVTRLAPAEVLPQVEALPKKIRRQSRLPGGARPHCRRSQPAPGGRQRVQGQRRLLARQNAGQRGPGGARTRRLRDGLAGGQRRPGRSLEGRRRRHPRSAHGGGAVAAAPGRQRSGGPAKNLRYLAEQDAVRRRQPRAQMLDRTQQGP